MLRTLCLLAILILPGARAAAQEEPDLVGAFLAATDPKARIELREKILAAAPDPAETAARLAEGRSYSADVEKGWLSRRNLCSDGVERPYLLFVPEDYDPATRYRMVVDMHGGVARPATLTHAELEQMKFFWGEHAAEQGYLLALPTGQAGAEWWTDVGAHNVITLIDRVGREYNVDENLVFATGFSDGGSGSYYLALTRPTMFAGFIPLNGHPSVAGARGLQIHPRNFVNKPMYAVNTEKDSLYPAASVKPIMDALAEIGAPVVWRNIPEFTHNPMYLPQERPAIWKWAQETRRDPHPKRIVWEGTADAPHRVHWLSVEGVGETGNDAEFPDVNPLLPPGRMRIGVSLDRSFPGPGLRVVSVVDASPAAAAGVKAEDVITALDDTATPDMSALRTALGRKSSEDAFTVTVTRGEETLTLEGKFPKVEPRPAFRRTKPYGSIEAVADGNRFDVRCRAIKAFDLYLSPQLVDLAKPVTVTVNGKTVHEAVVAPDLAFLLDMALADDDRTMIYLAKLPIAVAGKAEGEEAAEDPEKPPGPPKSNRMQPDHAPTPFSAEEIRRACPAGRVSKLRIDTPGRAPALSVTRFTGGGEEFAEMEIVSTDLEGKPLQRARTVRLRWTDLQAHGSYPAARTAIDESRVKTPVGEFACWLYTVTMDGSVIQAFFAKDLPGPPVKMIQLTNGKVTSTMTLVENSGT